MLGFAVTIRGRDSSALMSSGLEIVGVDEVDAAAYDVGQGGAATFEDIPDVGEDLPRLLLDIARDDLSGDRVDGDLAGNVDAIAGAHGRRVGTAWSGRAGGKDLLDHGLVSFRF